MNESEIQALEFEVHGMMSDVEFNPTLMELSLGFRSSAGTSGYRTSFT